ncbi:glycosyltransferase [Alloprevotella sp. oral taxon 473]|uniref:glycosyltransferase n=1 Tax=Alloprevotella sp. oral taxon 473 TaxID=712469 RepID=UPI00034675E9|nr:glycosyltransferase [Alloprevotella sp. oral taxon 473]
MKIAFLSSLDPTNIRSWSGTLHHMLHALQQHNEVEWVGGDLYEEKWQMHQMKHPQMRFIPEMYVDYWGVMLEDFFRLHHYDVIIARDYYFIAQLDTTIPIIYVGDTTTDLMKKYLRLPTHFANFADLVEHDTIERATQVVYSSEWSARNAIDHYEASPDKVHVIEFGSNLIVPASEQTLPQYQEVCHLLFVAKDWEMKGGQEVLDTYRLLQQKGFPCQLTLIGKHPNNLPEDVEAIDFLDKSKTEGRALLVQKFREANFFFMPTKFDCFGIVYAEAATFGLPSLATNVGGVSQVVREGVNGMLFSPNDTPETMAERIIALYQHREAYEQLCRSAQTDARQRLNWQVWGEKMQGILETTLENLGIQPSTQTVATIPTYVINLKQRTERKEHIINEFNNHPEFDAHLVEACEHPNGAVGLWQSICKIVRQAKAQHLDYVLICEDDHCFTQHYSKEYFHTNLQQAQKQGALLLNGGIGGFGTAVRVSAHRYWVDWFWSTQFVVIYAPLFDDILAYAFQATDTADGVLSALTPYKMAIYPFISVQKGFGYSDVSESNDRFPERVEHYFEKSSQRLAHLHNISQYFLHKG